MNNISSNILNFLAKSNYGYDYDSGGGFFTFFFWFLAIIGLYVYVSIVLMKIAKKTNTPHAWMAWIPILKNYLLCKIAGKSIIWFILLFIPFISIVAAVVLLRCRGRYAAVLRGEFGQSRWRQCPSSDTCAAHL